MGDPSRLVVALLVALGVLAGCSSAAPTAPPPATSAPAAAVATPGRAPLPPVGDRNGPRICEKFESEPVAGGRFEVQNNAWGADTPQCTTAFDTGFSVRADHEKDSGPAAYPSIVWGCNHGTCTTGTPFPRPLADLGDVRSSWAFTVPDEGRFNAAYDIWLDPTPRRDGDNTGAELMIWQYTAGGIDPIGPKTGTAELAGTTWDVHEGSNGDLPVISYVRQRNVTEVLDLPVSDFVTDAERRGVVSRDWFLTNLQAGFEPWTGGTGLVTDAFAATRDGV